MTEHRIAPNGPVAQALRKAIEAVEQGRMQCLVISCIDDESPNGTVRIFIDGMGADVSLCCEAIARKLDGVLFFAEPGGTEGAA